MEWEPVSERIITAIFVSKCQKLSVMQEYASTNDAAEEVKEAFYHQLQTVYNETSRRDVTLLIGYFNAKIDCDNADMETVMGRNGLGSMNEEGEIFADFCVSNDLIIGGTISPHRPCRKAMWRSLDAELKIKLIMSQLIDAGEAH